jgi:hypothetical protein
MNRDRLDRWLTGRHRTTRWPTDDNADHYAAVETTDDGLRWFSWSHLHGEDGLTREERQSYADFAENGPRWPIPEAKLRELIESIEKREIG